MDVEAIRRSLTAERSSTLARITAMSAELDALARASAGSNLDDEHDPEGSTVAFEREQFSALRSRAQQHLADIDAALERLADGRYGVCEGCGQPVAAQRLDALPTARLCFGCASKR